jgi:hypothetical protein
MCDMLRQDALTSRHVYLRFEYEYTGLASQSWGPEEAQENGRPLRLVLLRCSLENTAQARQSAGPVVETRYVSPQSLCVLYMK